MSKSARRYSNGTPESRGVKRAVGKKITHAAVGKALQKSKSKTKTVSAPRGVIKSIQKVTFSLIKDLAAQTEINRRADVIRAELVRQILAPGGHPLLGGDFVTYINILIQLPILVFFYKKVDGKFAYRKHFDVNKFKVSRGSLRLVSPSSNNIDVDLADLENSDENRARLFRIFNTKFYVRCFILDTRKDDQPFYEITANLETSLGIQYEYTRVLLQNLFDSNSSDLSFYSKSFRAALFDKIEKTLEDFEYVEPQADRGKITTQTVEETSALSMLNYFASGRRPSYKNEGLYKEFSERLNNSIEDAAYSASLLKKNSHVTGGENLEKNAPNMFLMLRAYEREKNNRRASVKDVFRGYAYDTRFNISVSQREKIKSYLKRLGQLGKDGYKKLGGVNGFNELYGGYENPRNQHWDFGKSKDAKRDIAYRNFAKSLDEWFWLYLKPLRNLRIKFIVDTFLSPIGSQSISMVDPLFYYGASIYRMPFRRDGGLERLKGLANLYEELTEEEENDFSFSMLRKIENISQRIELQRDCIRVIVFFYLTRLFAINNGNQAELYTKVHLYPIDVGGVVVGSIGKISFDSKEEKRKHEDIKLPTIRQTWDEEVMFLSSVVLPIRASLRRQYRDLHLEYLVNQFSTELYGIVNTSKDKIIADLDKFESVLNKSSLAISKVCPYPSVSFKFEENSTPLRESKLTKIVDLGGVKLIIRQERLPSIFRYLTRQKNQLTYDISRSLALRLDEVAKQLLQRARPDA